MASKARTARVVTSASTNPQFTLPQIGAHFMYGETAAYQFVFGNWDLGAQDPKDMIHTLKEMVQYFVCTYDLRDTFCRTPLWLMMLLDRERAPAI